MSLRTLVTLSDPAAIWLCIAAARGLGGTVKFTLRGTWLTTLMIGWPSCGHANATIFQLWVGNPTREKVRPQGR